MFKQASIVCIALLASAALAQDMCPRSKEVGNYINYLHLFAEENRGLLSFYNAKTTVDLIYESYGSCNQNMRDHKVAFLVNDNNTPVKSWIYAVWVKLDCGTEVILDIYNFAKFRSFPDDAANNDPALRFRNADYLKSLFSLQSLPSLNSIFCYQSVMKLEFDYFYYMFANYFKSGLGLNAPKTI